MTQIPDQAVPQDAKLAAIKAYTKIDGKCRPVAMVAALTAAAPYLTVSVEVKEIEIVRETLSRCDAMFRLDLHKQIEWNGDGFNQSIFDTHERVKQSLSVIDATTNEGTKPVDVASVREAISSVNIHDEANGYEWRGEGGDYTPKSHEKAMLEDFGHNLISQIDDAIRALSAAPTSKGGE